MRDSEPLVDDSFMFTTIQQLDRPIPIQPREYTEMRTPLGDEEKSDIDEQEFNEKDQADEDQVKPAAAVTGGPIAPAAAAGGPPKAGPFALPPDHPMHPSQFAGDQGSKTAMLSVLGGFLAVFVSFGWVNCIGVFQEYYQTHQLKNYPPSTVSWITSLETFFMFAGGPVVGKIYDNYGPRYLLLTGTVLHVFGLMMASLSTEYYQFILSQGICSPIGASMLFFPAMNVVLSWYFKWRATAFGIIAAGSSLGGVIFPIMVTKLVPQIGFAWTMRVCAFLILGCLIITNLTVKSRLKPNPTPLVLKEFVLPLKERPYLLLVTASFWFFLTIFNPIAYIVVQASTTGMSKNLQGYLIPILNAASILGRTSPGYLADILGRFNVMIIFCAFTALINFAIWIPAHSNATLILYAAFYGFGSGAFVSLYSPLIAQITAPEKMSKLGIRNGTAFAIVSVSALVGQPIAGALITADKGRFLALQVFTGAVQVVGLCLYVVTRISIYGVKPKKV